MGWAQAALERNPDIQVISVNRRAGTLTVRLRDSGVTRVVAAAQVMGTVPEDAAAAAGRVHLLEMPSGQVTPAALAAAPESTASEPAAAAPGTSAAQAFASDIMAPPAAAAPAAASQPTVLKPGQRVFASGPGYSIIVSSTGRAPAAAVTAPQVTNSPLERMREPIDCDGPRVLRIDNRNLEFSGNAITATNGCEVLVINSRIAAGGIGILARNASVHVENSQIIGRAASLEAADGAQMYVETSTIEGARRRLDDAAIHDLGENTWD